MTIHLHQHARDRMIERGATEKEIIDTVEHGAHFPVKFGRTGFRREFVFEQTWHDRFYQTKQLEVIAAPESDWLVLTVIVRFF